MCLLSTVTIWTTMIRCLFEMPLCNTAVCLSCCLPHTCFLFQYRKLKYQIWYWCTKCNWCGTEWQHYFQTAGEPQSPHTVSCRAAHMFVRCQAYNILYYAMITSVRVPVMWCVIARSIVNVTIWFFLNSYVC